MKKYNEIIIPRCYCINEVTDPVINIEIHGFSDASEQAYGSCIYLKFRKSCGDVKTALVTSKSRIVSLKKKFTIPKLELLGNFLLSKLIVNVLNALNEELIINRVFCWTDSQISLAWIKAEKKEFKVFVQNRVIDIRKHVSSSDKWFYVKSEDNPADIITRMNCIVNQNLWWHGPRFLLDVENYFVNTACHYN